MIKPRRRPRNNKKSILRRRVSEIFLKAETESVWKKVRRGMQEAERGEELRVLRESEVNDEELTRYLREAGDAAEA